MLESNNNMNPIEEEMVICCFYLSSSIEGLSPEQGQVTERERKEKEIKKKKGAKMTMNKRKK